MVHQAALVWHIVQHAGRSARDGMLTRHVSTLMIPPILRVPMVVLPGMIQGWGLIRSSTRLLTPSEELMNKGDDQGATASSESSAPIVMPWSSLPRRLLLAPPSDFPPAADDVPSTPSEPIFFSVAVVLVLLVISVYYQLYFASSSFSASSSPSSSSLSTAPPSPSSKKNGVSDNDLPPSPPGIENFPDSDSGASLASPSSLNLIRNVDSYADMLRLYQDAAQALDHSSQQKKSSSFSYEENTLCYRAVEEAMERSNGDPVKMNQGLDDFSRHLGEFERGVADLRGDLSSFDAKLKKFETDVGTLHARATAPVSRTRRASAPPFLLRGSLEIPSGAGGSRGETERQQRQQQEQKQQ